METVKRTDSEENRGPSDRNQPLWRAYRGELGVEVMLDTQARLAWLCGLIHGDRVLELGPSRGLLSALLAESGCSVIRVCEDKQCQAAAERQLAAESAETSGRVLVVDAGWLCSEAAVEQRCDSAIVYGRLENLAQSAAVLDRIARILVDGGRFAMAFPFATAEFSQPERARQVTVLLSGLNTELELTRWEIIGGWLGATAVRSTRKVSIPEEASGNEPLDAPLPGFSEITLDVNRVLNSADPSRLDEPFHMPWSSLTARERALRGSAAQQNATGASSPDQGVRGSLPAASSSISATFINDSMQVSDSNRKVRELEAQVRRLEWRCADAERRATQGRSTISFRLGQALIQAFKSWRGMKALPAALLSIRSDARLRRENAHKYGGTRVIDSTLREALLSPRAPASDLIDLGSSPIIVAFAYHPSEGAFAVVGRVDGSVRCALARIEYLDANRRPITGQLPGLACSPTVGPYRYLATGDERKALFSVTPPSSCRYVQLGFQLSPGARVARMSNLVSRAETGAGSAGHNAGRRRRDGPPTAPVAVSSLRLEAGRIGWPAPTSNGNAVGQHRKPMVLAVLDEFTTSCFAPDCVLVQPRPDNWQALAEQYRPDFLLIESAWKGNGGSWQYRVGSYANSPGDELGELVNFARYHAVPVVFWNKEDPVHYDKFLEAASMADVILTTDEGKVPDYQNATGNQRVQAFPFAAQPALHWPRALANRKERACFAGSWYGGRHATRADAMLWMLRATKQHGLDIYDRNYGQEEFSFPEDLRECVRGSLPYERLCQEYSAYRVFLNVNSVASSPTMFSRRVFELLASGTPIVSTYALGIERLLGADSVWFVESPAEASRAVQTLLHDDTEWRRRSLLGIRRVFSSHTYAHRVAELCRLVGLDRFAALEPRVLIAMEVESDSDLDHLCSFRQGQSCKSFELAAVDASNARYGPLRDQGILSFQSHEALACHLKGNGDPATRYDLFGRIHASAQYGADYLLDLINATRYAPSADGWAKSRRIDLFQIDTDFDEYGCLVRVDRLTTNEIGPLKLLAIQVHCIDSSEFVREESGP